MRLLSISDRISTLCYNFFLRNGLEIRRTGTKAPIEQRTIFSQNEEQQAISNLLQSLGVREGFCVDIAASDGVTISNTYALFRAGWAGLAAEFNAKAFTDLANNYRTFEKVALAKCLVTPLNVDALLGAYNVPEDFDLLNLDVDGYDYFILEKIFSRYRPKLVCAEINEKIPPPLKFTVRWSPEYEWDTSHFYGQSMSKLSDLAAANNYALVELHYNNAMLVPQELWQRPSLTPEQAYNSGYRDKSDRRAKFPWNKDVDHLLDIPAEEALLELRQLFRKHEGMYELSM